MLEYVSVQRCIVVVYVWYKTVRVKLSIEFLKLQRRTMVYV